MAIKIILTVVYWLYAFVIFFTQKGFIDDAPKGCEEGRKLIVTAVDILVIGTGILLAAVIWSN